MTCKYCNKEVQDCTFDCHIQEARDAGGKEFRPNGLPVTCIQAFDNTMLECEHGDHDTYIFPVTVLHLEEDDNTPEEETHALIYTDKQVALTLNECRYWLWSLCDGNVLRGPCGGAGWRLSADSLAAVKAYNNKSELTRLRKALLECVDMAASQAPSVEDNTTDEYRRGQKRGALDAAVMVQRVVAKALHIPCDRSPEAQGAVRQKLTLTQKY